MSNEIKKETVVEPVKVEKDYYTKNEVNDLINKTIIEQLTNLIKNNDKVEDKKEEVKEEKKEQVTYE
ncbi:hypothetical protein [Clostridium sp.]|uniref:hypothetical protein n=1 Tax=Clostridium sp. TaxID=1506 RepID=UPI00262E622D|nr:hypothetical protein [Clostridium sp.]